MSLGICESEREHRCSTTTNCSGKPVEESWSTPEGKPRELEAKPMEEGITMGSQRAEEELRAINPLF